MTENTAPSAEKANNIAALWANTPLAATLLAGQSANFFASSPTGFIHTLAWVMGSLAVVFLALSIVQTRGPVPLFSGKTGDMMVKWVLPTMLGLMAVLTLIHGFSAFVVAHNILSRVALGFASVTALYSVHVYRRLLGAAKAARKNNSDLGGNAPTSE